MSKLEEVIREIVRDELSRQLKFPRPYPLQPEYTEARMAICGCQINTACGNAACPHIPRATASYYAHYNGAAVFVKEGEFFRSQGGLEEEWGKGWHPVNAASIEEARRSLWKAVRAGRIK